MDRFGDRLLAQKAFDTAAEKPYNFSTSHDGDLRGARFDERAREWFPNCSDDSRSRLSVCSHRGRHVVFAGRAEVARAEEQVRASTHHHRSHYPSPMFKLLLETLFAPNRALRRVAEERPVLPAAVIALLGAWGWAFGARLAFSAGFLTPADLVRQFFPMTASLFRTAYEGHWLSLLLLFFPVALFAWFFRSASLHLLAELWGGSGKGFSVLATVGFADLPLLLLPLTAWLCRLIAGSPPSVGGVTLWYVLAALLHLWSWTLTVFGIRLTHRLPTGTAAGVCVLVLVAFLGVSLLLTFAGPSMPVTR